MTLQFSVDRGFRHSWAGFSGAGSLTRLQSKGWLGLQSSQGLSERRSTCKLTCLFFVRIRVLTGCWPGSLAPWNCLQVCVSLNNNKSVLQENCPPITFSHILCIRSDFLGLSFTQGQRLDCPVYEIQQMKLTRSHFR